MNRNWLFREVAEIALLVLAASFAGVLMVSAGSCVVGGRAPSPSQSNSTDSGMAPARPLADGNGEDVAPVEGVEVAPRYATTPQPEPASTVTQSALAAVPTVVIDAVPATTVASAARVETIAPQSINRTGEESSPVQPYGGIVRFDPWPAYLWPTVACIVQRESRGDPYAVGKAGERGLMQVHPVTWPYLAQYGITPDSLFDPATNLRAGYLLFIEAGGLRPWGGGCA